MVLVVLGAGFRREGGSNRQIGQRMRGVVQNFKNKNHPSHHKIDLVKRILRDY